MGAPARKAVAAGVDAVVPVDSVDTIGENYLQARTLAKRLISFRIDDELAAELDRDMAHAKREAEARDSEFSEPIYLRMLLRKGLRSRERQRKVRKSKP